MTRPTHNTLPGSRWAVLALVVASAAIAYDHARSSCHKPAPVQTTLTRTF